MKKKVMSMSEVVEYTSLSRATIYRHRKIQDFPEPISLTTSRIVFWTSDVDDWLETRPKKLTPEVVESKRRVRCPLTPSEMDEARLRECAELKAKKQGDAS